MAAVTICSDFGAQKDSLTLFPLFPHLFPMKWWDQMPLLLLSRFSRVRLCATPQTAAHQAPRSMGFSRQEYRSGLPFPSPISLINDYKIPYAFFCLYVLFQFQKVHYKKEKGWIWGKEEEETWTRSKDFIFNPHFYYQKNIVSFIHLFNFLFVFTVFMPG